MLESGTLSTTCIEVSGVCGGDTDRTPRYLGRGAADCRCPRLCVSRFCYRFPSGVRGSKPRVLALVTSAWNIDPSLGPLFAVEGSPPGGDGGGRRAVAILRFYGFLGRPFSCLPSWSRVYCSPATLVNSAFTSAFIGVARGLMAFARFKLDSLRFRNNRAAPL